MKKETIEANDLKFREKLPELRSNLASRRQGIHVKGKLSIIIKLLIPLLMVAVVVYYWTGKSVRNHQPVSEAIPIKQKIEKPKQPEILDQTDAAQAFAKLESANSSSTGDAPPGDSQEANPNPTALVSVSKAVDLPPAVETPSLPEALSKNPAPSEIQATDTSIPRAVSSIDTGQSAADLAENSKEPEKDTAIEPAVSTAASPLPIQSRITRSLTCMGVLDRECLQPQSIFALNTNPNPHVWMEVHSESIPYVLKHVYYHEGRKYCEVPLKITYPRMRTWSNVTLKNPTYAGAWRVEIVSENGTVLEEIDFRVEN